MKKTAFAALVLCALLSACRAEPEPISPYRFVTAVEVQREPSGAWQRYTDKRKIERLLTGLRSIAPRHPDVQNVPQGGCTVRLELSGGRSAVYRQNGACFLQRNDAPFARVDAEQALHLRLLLYALPPDG